MSRVNSNDFAQKQWHIIPQSFIHNGTIITQIRASTVYANAHHKQQKIKFGCLINFTYLLFRKGLTDKSFQADLSLCV